MMSMSNAKAEALGLRTPDSELSPEQLKTRREYEAMKAAFARVSTVGKFEMLRFSSQAIGREPVDNGPLPPELEPIKDACHYAIDTLGNHLGQGRGVLGYQVDRTWLAHTKDLLPAFIEVANRLPAGSSRANYAAFVPMMMGMVSGGRSGFNKRKMARAQARVNKIMPTALDLVAQSFAGMRPMQALKELEKSSLLLEHAGVEPRFEVAVHNVLQGLEVASGSRQIQAGIRRVRGQIADCKGSLTV